LGKKSKIVAIREKGNLEPQPETELRREGWHYPEEQRGIWAKPSADWERRVRNYDDSNTVGLFLDLLQHSGVDVEQLLYDLHVYNSRTVGPSPEVRKDLINDRAKFGEIINQIEELRTSIGENGTIAKVSWHEGVPSLEEQLGEILPLPGDVESALNILSTFAAHLAARNAYYSSEIQRRNRKDDIVMANWREKIREAIGNNYCNKTFTALVIAGESASWGPQPDRDLSPETLNKRLNTAAKNERHEG
jgi:hypothetical protein